MGDEIGFLPAILGNGLLHAVVLASIGLAICSLSGRRAYAAAAILAIFLVGSVMTAMLTELEPSWDIVVLERLDVIEQSLWRATQRGPDIRETRVVIILLLGRNK